MKANDIQFNSNPQPPNQDPSTIPLDETMAPRLPIDSFFKLVNQKR